MSLLFGWVGAFICLGSVAWMFLIFRIFSGVIDELLKIKKGDKK